MTILVKIILPIYLALFFGLAMFWRSYLACKRTGINPYKLGGGDTVNDYMGKLFCITLIGTALIVLAFSLQRRGRHENVSLQIILLVPMTDMGYYFIWFR
jgi:hypothetical protein